MLASFEADAAFACLILVRPGLDRCAIEIADSSLLLDIYHKHFNRQHQIQKVCHGRDLGLGLAYAILTPQLIAIAQA